MKQILKHLFSSPRAGVKAPLQRCWYRSRGITALLLIVLSALVLMPQPSYAQVYTEIPEGTCTTQEEYGFDIPEVPAGGGLIANIVDAIATPLETVAEDVFDGIVSDTGFQNVVRLSSSIYVALYGILFMFGMVQITVHDFFMRLIKLGIMNVLVSGNAWGFFNDTVVHFFNDGVDDLISTITAIGFSNAVGGVIGASGNPFDPLDQALVVVVSTKMVVCLLATFFTGPYGFVIGFILLMSLGSFLKAIFNALWVYVMSLVIRSLMFGMAPIFLVCILFSRTRHLFEGWLNQIVNASLQPVFLFTFFTFFVTLLKASMDMLLDRPVCLMPAEVQIGTPQIWNTWRFAIHDCGGGTLGVGDWAPFDGRWGFDGVDSEYKACGNTEIHPIGIMLPLMIWILADLAGRFNHIVVEIAKDLANASTDLSMGAAQVGGWFNKAMRGGGGPGAGTPGATGQRPGAGGNLPGIERLVDNIREQASASTGGRAGPGTGTTGGSTPPAPPPPPKPPTN